MAYAAVISLKQTIHRILNSSHFSIPSSSRAAIEFAYNETTSLQEVLKDWIPDCSSERLSALDGEIRDEVHRLEDLLEVHASDQSENLEDVIRQWIDSFSQTVKKMKEEEVDTPSHEQDIHDATPAPNLFPGAINVGLDEEELSDILYRLIRPIRPVDFGVFSIVGIPGTCRTVAASDILYDICIDQEHAFDCVAWVSIGTSYEFSEILLRIIAQTYDFASTTGDEFIIWEGEEKIAEYLYASLMGRRFMIVLDDVCDRHVWDQLRSSIPEQNNGSLVLITTSFREIAVIADSYYTLEFPIMTEDRTWGILEQDMLMSFEVVSLGPELEEAGKKIARNCKGLRMSLAKVVLFLSETEMMPEKCKELASQEDNPIFIVTDEISESRKLKEDLQLCNAPNLAQRVAIGLASSMLDLSNVTKVFKRQMLPKRFFPKMDFMSFFGMTGIGKTTFLKRIFEAPLLSQYFDHRVWIDLGPRYRSEKILFDILAQIYPGIDKILMENDTKLANDLCTQLADKRCLVVLDDVRSKEPLHSLKKLFPGIKGKLLVTTRLAKVVEFEESYKEFEMQLLSLEHSWLLLRQKVFGTEYYPLELEKPGRQIAQNCDGLPLTIVKVANLLCKAEKSTEYWNEVAKKQSSVFTQVYEDISNVILPSYKIVPQHLKPCFLYMGVFRQSYEISVSKLISLWIVEGLIEPNMSQTLEDVAEECLLELANRSLVLINKMISNFGMKTCRLHSIFWHLSNREAMKNKFFHALNTYGDGLIEGLKFQRRFCIRNNIIFCLKEVQDAMASISTAHSLLFTCPPYKYPVKIHFSSRLLRVLDALALRFYEFPIEVLKLIRLRYFALTYDGNLPASLSRLWDLEYLIIGQHVSVKSFGDFLCMPMEIWDMKELKHLQVMGRTLVNPIHGASLPQLSTLLDVNAQSCTESVFKSIPNLQRLGIRIELEPNDNDTTFHCLDHISCLNRLESLKCVIVNPEVKSMVVAPPTSTMFPPGLKKLTLSGLGYPWEYINIIGKLQNLEVLKLRCYAFQGSEWEFTSSGFTKLKYLLIEDTDLVRWKTKTGGFLDIKYLRINHCYNLEELPNRMSSTLEMIEVVDCNPSVLTWAMQMKEMMDPFSFESFKVQGYSSWDAAGNLEQ